tara:strand:- start:1 stop:330 length:330 start_codon:yes stop_codon:yes gene_type:complete
MAITYKFEVTKLSRDPSTDVVKTLDWKYTATDDTDGISVSEHGINMGFEPLDVNDSKFIKYSDLTEAKVKEWWEAEMNKNFHTIEELHQGMGYRIANEREVTEKTDLPW